MNTESHGKGDLEKLPHICSFITTFTSSLCPSLECCRVVQVLQNKRKTLIADIKKLMYIGFHLKKPA